MPRCSSWLERKFRRKFIETDELLGRGKVLTAFARNDQERLDITVDKNMIGLKKKIKA